MIKYFKKDENINIFSLEPLEKILCIVTGEIYNGCFYQKEEDNSPNLYIEELDTIYFSEKVKYFIPLAEWREQQLKEILDD